MRLEFDRSLDTNVAGYNFYRRLTRPARRDNSEFVQFISATQLYFDVPAGYEHYIWFTTTVDSDGNESTSTNLVVPASLTLPPRNLRVVPGITTVPPPPPPTDTTPPVVTITAPANGSTQTAAFVVTVTATDNVAVAGVKLFIDGNQWQAEITTAPYEWTVNPAGLTNASHTLLAQARDTNNNVASSAQISFTVNNPPVSGDTQAPTVTIDSPANGATVSGSVPILFTATDNVNIASVQVKVNGQNHGSPNTQVTSGVQQAGLPFDASTRPNGQYQITATATDGAGNVGNSTVTTVTVNTTATPIPAGYPAADANSTYPRTWLDRTYSLPAGQTWIANTATEFQNALDNCVQGDKIQLTAGNTYVGNFLLRNKSGNGWIYIISSAVASLPAATVNAGVGRVNPSLHAQFMPKIVTPNSSPAIRCEIRSHHYRFVGCEIAATITVPVSSLVIVDLGQLNSALGGSESYPGNINDQPQFIYFDRCYIHAAPGSYCKRAMYLNGRSMAVFKSHIDEIHLNGGDGGVGIGTITGAGPFCIFDNTIKASGMPYLIGGAPPWIQDLVPSDIEISHNHMSRSLTWWHAHPSYQGTFWAIKNGGELKNSRYVLIHGNIVEYVPVVSQHAQSFMHAPRAQESHATWTSVDNVTTQYNICRNAAAGFSTLATDDNLPSQRCHHLTTRHNLLYLIDYRAWGGEQSLIGKTWAVTAGPALTYKFYHNTVIFNPVGNQAINYSGGALTGANLYFHDNIFTHGSHGAFLNSENTGGGPVPQGESQITWMLQGGTFTKNVFYGPFGVANPTTFYGSYGSTNFFPAAIGNVGFTDPNNHNYALSGSSPYRNAATDGTDIGANIAGINTATTGVVVVP
jgi:hypothetical protein